LNDWVADYFRWNGRVHAEDRNMALRVVDLESNAGGFGLEDSDDLRLGRFSEANHSASKI
jgi:hypothetical protein